MNEKNGKVELALRIGLAFIQKMTFSDFLDIQKQTDHELLPALLRLIAKKNEVKITETAIVNV